ncbi:MAG: YcxB family protein [Pyrinomonadaceae bacterium]
MESVSVHFKLSEQEFMAGARLLTFPTAGAKARVAIGLPLYAVGVWFILLALNFSLFASTVVGALLLAGFACLIYFTRFTLTRRCYRGDQKFRHGITLTFTDDHVQVQAREIDSKLGWKLYTDVLEGETCYVLVYGKDVRMMTVVPKRAFKSKRQERAFRGLLATHFDRKLTAPQIDDGAAEEADYQPAGLQPPDWR